MSASASVLHPHPSTLVSEARDLAVPACGGSGSPNRITLAGSAEAQRLKLGPVIGLNWVGSITARVPTDVGLRTWLRAQAGNVL